MKLDGTQSDIYTSIGLKDPGKKESMIGGITKRLLILEVIYKEERFQKIKRDLFRWSFLSLPEFSETYFED